MRRTVLALLALTLAAPAGAQIAGRPGYGDVRIPDRLGPTGRVPGPSPAREARDIRSDIRDLRESGAITRREARRMSREATVLGRTDSLSAPAARAVEAQLLALRSRVATAQASSEQNRRRRSGR